ncbi:protein of unknown function [Taphrina deformans PYCC 5710]|uniref:Transcription factor domain-containing protein n=1 Tax=Taphrina deformans (strain PYCC 5710 / ATCC 11124 / CBS 356.35 / IMI 108563 / JCM 9778 / NBRC 8474) TaxID=1097556 RepID=R4XEN5_TAPDE|nr:protein of unknown function [Taphrina deformans PYCC 5710]|eukprot:CCG84312.1 protein of unknown function [Taphrina deformans PYCC 5710]
MRSGCYTAHPGLTLNTTSTPPDLQATPLDAWARSRSLFFEQSSLFKFPSLDYRSNDRRLYIDIVNRDAQTTTAEAGNSYVSSASTKIENDVEDSFQLPVEAFLAIFDIQPDDFTFALNKHLQNSHVEAFLDQLRTPATFLVFSDTWTDILRGEADLTMLLAARACGAIHVGHLKSAKILYDSCLDRLKHTPPDLVVTDSLSYLKVCATILIMFSWEMNSPGMTRDRFLVHFHGVAKMLKEYVPSHGAAVAERGHFDSIETVLLKLLLTEYRTCECVASALFRIPPSISLQVYDHLQSQSGISFSMDRDTDIVNNVYHLAASAFDTAVPAKLEALDNIALVLRRASWHERALCETLIAPDREFSTAEPRPFQTGLCVARATTLETWQTTLSLMYCEAAILRLQMTMVGEVKAQGHEVLAKADNLIRLAWFLMNFEIRGNFPWTSLVLMIAYETYALLSGPNDVCRDWTRRLCLQVVQKVGVGMASIFTQELIRIDRQRIIL